MLSTSLPLLFINTSCRYTEHISFSVYSSISGVWVIAQAQVEWITLVQEPFRRSMIKILLYVPYLSLVIRLVATSTHYWLAGSSLLSKLLEAYTSLITFF